MEGQIIGYIVLVIGLGIGAQWLGWTLKIPSILLLLIVGFLAGPVTGIIPPETLHGHWLFAFVSLAIGVILFEGGLSLQIGELSGVGRSVRNLITTGVVITGALAGLLAWWVIGMPLEVAILTGGILTVTGPTVVIPLLKHVRPHGRVNAIAKWEGITIDPVGAIVAVLLLEAILTVGGGTGEEGALQVLIETSESLLLVGVLSIGVSIIGAALQIFILRRHLVPDYLQDPAALAIVLGSYAVAHSLGGEEAALLTTTLMGIILANQPWVSVKRIVKFKEDLQVLLLACLFILLSARLDVSVLTHINAQAFIFLALLILLVRPLSVFICSIGTGLNWKEKAFMSWVAPRGIVAAAVAALFAERLVANGYPEAAGDALIATVYLVVVGTVAVYGLTLGPISLRLGLADRNPQGVLFMGAYRWVQDAAKALQELGYRVLLIDANARNIAEAHKKQLPAVVGDALAENSTDELDLGGLKSFIAVTANDEINALAALHFTEVFENKEVYQIAIEGGGGGEGARQSTRQRGRPLFGNAYTQQHLTKRYAEGAKVCVFYLSTSQSYQAVVEKFGADIVLLFVVRGNNVMVNAESNQLTPQQADLVIVQLPPPDKVAVSDADDILLQSSVIDADRSATLDEVLISVSREFGNRLRMGEEFLEASILESFNSPSAMYAVRGAVVLHLRLDEIRKPAVALVRTAEGMKIPNYGSREGTPVYACILFITPKGSETSEMLATHAQITGSVSKSSFEERWLAAKTPEELRATVMAHPTYFSES